MDTLTRKKIILRLLDSDPKLASEIANEIGESLPIVKKQLIILVSENICEKMNGDEVSQYIVRKDIEAFTRLVKEFLSEKEEHDEEKEQFITSEYYFARIDNELVDYVLGRFYIDSVYYTDEEKEGTRRILLTSPSGLLFALHEDTTKFHESWAHRNQLNPSDEDQERITGIVRSGFMRPLLEMLIADIRDSAYGFLHNKLQIRMAKINIQIILATPHEKYIDAIEGGITSFHQIEEGLKESLRPGQWMTFVDPIDFSNYGLALLHLGEYQAALKDFDKALDKVEDPTQKAIVLNNKGLAFLRFQQYRKAIECFEEGIVLDSESEISELRDNKQLAEKYLVQATDADDLTQPTRVPFVQGLPMPFAETRFYEFKEIIGGNAARSITDTSDVYAVAFLNREGGRIFWGVRNSDRITVGITLDERQRDNVRRKVSEKLGAIRPPISVEDWALEFHSVDDLQGEIVEDLWVIELVVSCPQQRDIFYTSRGELHVKTEGGKKKLLGPEVTEFIRRHFQDATETD